ncbi:hypothetical protein KCP74_19885 [Salmonella enterica subsp. enterica]|nr:hypothetical protein KCP74_19885 [Salmonella enterica subsp. enterica]
MNLQRRHAGALLHAENFAVMPGVDFVLARRTDSERAQMPTQPLFRCCLMNCRSSRRNNCNYRYQHPVPRQMALRQWRRSPRDGIR